MHSAKFGVETSDMSTHIQTMITLLEERAVWQYQCAKDAIVHLRKVLSEVSKTTCMIGQVSIQQLPQCVAQRQSHIDCRKTALFCRVWPNTAHQSSMFI